MSLKALHIFFVSCSTLLALGVAVWCVMQFFDKKGAGYLLAGIGSAGAGVGLVWYGVAVYRKLKNMSWM